MDGPGPADDDDDVLHLGRVLGALVVYYIIFPYMDGSAARQVNALLGSGLSGEI